MKDKIRTQDEIKYMYVISWTEDSNPVCYYEIYEKIESRGENTYVDCSCKCFNTLEECIQEAKKHIACMERGE